MREHHDHGGGKSSSSVAPVGQQLRLILDEPGSYSIELQLIDLEGERRHREQQAAREKASKEAAAGAASTEAAAAAETFDEVVSSDAVFFDLMPPGRPYLRASIQAAFDAGVMGYAGGTLFPPQGAPDARPEGLGFMDGAARMLLRTNDTVAAHGGAAEGTEGAKGGAAGVERLVSLASLSASGYIVPATAVLIGSTGPRFDGTKGFLIQQQATVDRRLVAFANLDMMNFLAPEHEAYAAGVTDERPSEETLARAEREAWTRAASSDTNSNSSNSSNSHSSNATDSAELVTIRRGTDIGEKRSGGGRSMRRAEERTELVDAKEGLGPLQFIMTRRLHEARVPVLFRPLVLSLAHFESGVDFLEAGMRMSRCRTWCEASYRLRFLLQPYANILARADILWRVMNEYSDDFMSLLLQLLRPGATRVLDLVGRVDTPCWNQRLSAFKVEGAPARRWFVSDTAEERERAARAANLTLSARDSLRPWPRRDVMVRRTESESTMVAEVITVTLLMKRRSQAAAAAGAAVAPAVAATSASAKITDHAAWQAAVEEGAEAYLDSTSVVATDNVPSQCLLDFSLPEELMGRPVDDVPPYFYSRYQHTAEARITFGGNEKLMDGRDRRRQQRTAGGTAAAAAYTGDQCIRFSVEERLRTAKVLNQMDGFFPETDPILSNGKLTSAMAQVTWQRLPYELAVAPSHFTAQLEEVQNYGLDTLVTPGVVTDILLNPRDGDAAFQRKRASVCSRPWTGTEGGQLPLGADGSPEEAPVTIAFIARLSREKGIGVYMRAVRHALALQRAEEERTGVRRKMRFLAIGKASCPSYLTHVREALQQMGVAEAIDMVGFVLPEQLKAWYEHRCIDIVATPYLRALSETFGLVLAEAMVATVPVVHFGIGGIQDYARDRLNSILAPEFTAAAFGDSIWELVSNASLRHEIGANARAYVLKHLQAAPIARVAERRLRTDVVGGRFIYDFLPGSYRAVEEAGLQSCGGPESSTPEREHTFAPFNVSTEDLLARGPEAALAVLPAITWGQLSTRTLQCNHNDMMETFAEKGMDAIRNLLFPAGSQRVPLATGGDSSPVFAMAARQQSPRSHLVLDVEFASSERLSTANGMRKGEVTLRILADLHLGLHLVLNTSAVPASAAFDPRALSLDSDGLDFAQSIMPGYVDILCQPHDAWRKDPSPVRTNDPDFIALGCTVQDVLLNAGLIAMARVQKVTEVCWSFFALNGVSRDGPHSAWEKCVHTVDIPSEATFLYTNSTPNRTARGALSASLSALRPIARAGDSTSATAGLWEMEIPIRGFRLAFPAENAESFVAFHGVLAVVDSRLPRTVLAAARAGLEV
jgi:glycosyltransferase involved in cell wall biosynthesis